jgi:mannose-6-phosphate isomerase
MEMLKEKVFRLQGKLQHYDWGGKEFLPTLLQIPNSRGLPCAEYWMGAHDQASSMIVSPSGEPFRLDEYIRSFPEQTLGPEVSQAFGGLPYLLKVLDVRQMLSIQVHPTKENAEIEFLRENEAGIPRASAGRIYRDDNHKPELMLALGDFWLLHGFKPEREIRQLLVTTPEFGFLRETFELEGYKGVYRKVMHLSVDGVSECLGPLLDRIIPAYENSALTRDLADFWAARAALSFGRDKGIDRGIFSIYLFNLLKLKKGEAVFQQEGLPHAYLEGQNMEIMANSDNVLRGGLTSKRVAIEELMKQVRFEPTIPRIVPPEPGGKFLELFRTPARDFELGCFQLSAGEMVNPHSRSAGIYFVFSGAVQCREEKANSFLCAKGQSLVGFDRAAFSLTALADSIIYRAALPMK